MQKMRLKKDKNIKWWIGTVSFLMLFIGIGIFSYMKMDFLFHGVQISAKIDKGGTSPLVEVSGNAKNAKVLTLNGREIFIDKDGSFTESIALLPGFSVLTIDAKDKFGNSNEKKMQVVYQESTGSVAVGNTIINTN